MDVKCTQFKALIANFGAFVVDNILSDGSVIQS